MAIQNIKGILAANPFFSATKGSSILMSIRVKDADGKNVSMNCFLPKTGKPHPWSAFKAGDAVEVEYYTDTFNGKAVRRVRDIKAAAPEAVIAAETPAVETAEVYAGVQTTIDMPEGPVAETEGNTAEIAVRSYTRTLPSGKVITVRGHIRRHKVAC